MKVRLTAIMRKILKSDPQAQEKLRDMLVGIEPKEPVRADGKSYKLVSARDRRGIRAKTLKAS